MNKTEEPKTYAVYPDRNEISPFTQRFPQWVDYNTRIEISVWMKSKSDRFRG